MAKRKVNLEELDNHLYIDDTDQRLYWNDKLVHTEAIVALSGKQGFFFVAAAIATTIAAIFTIVGVVTTFCNYNTTCPGWLRNISSRPAAPIYIPPSTVPVLPSPAPLPAPQPTKPP
jgi:hypothetical protein